MSLAAKSGVRRTLVAFLPLWTGAALLLHIATKGSLSLMIVAAAVPLSIGAYLGWIGCSLDARSELSRRAWAGFLAGLLATAVYDGFRWFLLREFEFTFQPFHIFSIFGTLLLGPQAPPALVVAVGIAFHVSNGVGFAIGYAILFGARGVLVGLVWALALETIMLAVYPDWLHIKTLGEFRTISLLGHLAYGGVLGAVSRRILLSTPGKLA